MTHSEIVIREIPAKKAAAPTIAKILGEMSVTTYPISLLNSAPASRAGIMIRKVLWRRR